MPPSETPSVAPSPVAGCDDESISAAGTLVLRLEHFTETGRDWVISVYDDGRILTPGLAPYELSDEAWMIVRRLTADGVEALVNEVVATGLFEESASYNPVPLPGVEPPGRGGAGFSVTLAEGAGAIEVRWTSMFPDDATYYEPSPEREQLDAMAAHLVTFDEWLTEADWVSDEPCPYLPQASEVIVQSPQPWGGSLDQLPADVADVEWPLGGDILGWGEPFSVQGSNPDIDGRCGGVSRDEAQMLVTDLQSAGAETMGGELDLDPYVWMRLGYRAEAQFIDVWVEALLPDEAACVNPQPGDFGI